MTVIPDHTPLPAGDAPAMDPQRLVKAMERWRRRSRLIRFWRVALPLLMLMIAGGVLALVVVNTFFGGGRALEKDQDIRMLSPKFFGRNHSGSPYTVTSKDAVRDPAHMERIMLTQPHMVQQSLNGDPPTVIDADTGIYNENTHMLALDTHVRINNFKDGAFVSEHALVNTDEGTVDGQSPVSGSGPLGQITASSYAILDNGDHIVFMGNVKTHLVSK
jgi:lipopolysaccharide export system protein LptC